MYKLVFTQNVRAQKLASDYYANVLMQMKIATIKKLLNNYQSGIPLVCFL